jgi:hypothetical protein
LDKLRKKSAELDGLIAATKRRNERLRAAIRYVEAAPAEMRRHQGVAHDVVRQAERLVRTVRRAQSATLCEQLRHAYAALHHARRSRVACEQQRERELETREALGEAGRALERALVHVYGWEENMGCIMGELGGELAALRVSSMALARGEDVTAAEDHIARVRQWDSVAYSLWGLGPLGERVTVLRLALGLCTQPLPTNTCPDTRNDPYCSMRDVKLSVSRGAIRKYQESRAAARDARDHVIHLPKPTEGP